MSQKNQIKDSLNQTYDTNIFRVAFMADSIWSPVGSNIETDGSHPPFRMKKNSFYRQLWNYLNYNKPVFRSIDHANWTHSGGSTENGAYPTGANVDDRVRILSDDAHYSIIQITGHSTVVFWFEGGESGRAISTGTATFEVSTNGVDYVNPSITSLQGKKQTGRVNDTLVYDSPLNELDTNLVYPTFPARAIAYNNYISYREVQYNNLNPTLTYYFRIKRKAGTNSIRLGGCYYFTGKTCIFMNFSIPGVSQNGLIGQLYNTIGLHKINYLVAQSTIYHDYFAPAEIERLYILLITESKKYCTRISMCSCTPAAVVVEDSETSQGDEAPAYVKGQNVQKEFNHAVGFNLSASPAYADYPSRDAVYRCIIEGTDYDLTVVTPKPSEANYAAWTYNSKFRAIIYTEFPVDNAVYPLTLTKVSGSGANTLTANSRYYLPLPADETRDLIKSISDNLGIKFIDLYKLFSDLAIANNETIETDAYDITELSPLYSEYPDGMENYLSRYFQPNHWREAANIPVYNKFLNDLFTTFELE